MAPTSLSSDFKEFLRLLNDHGVEYLVIGGRAVAFHGYPSDPKTNKRASGRNKDLADLDQLPQGSGTASPKRVPP